MTADCLFCKIVAGDIPATVVHDGERTFAFRDINPQAPVHVLFIPKDAVATLNDLGADHAALIAKLFLAATGWAKQQGFADDGYRLVMNCNKHGGQTVFHIHLHLLAGRQMHWPPG